MKETWLEVTVDAARGELDDLCARLTMAGMAGLVIEEESDFRTFLEDHRQYWDYVDDALMERMRGASRVKFYVTDDEDGRAQLKRCTAGIAQSYTVLPLKESDWANSWQKYYKPLPVGRRLYIVPDWERSAPVPPDRTPLYLNPGLTFGTGSHASTQLCLEGLERYLPQNSAVLDLGCGSGVLSVAALKLGAAGAVGVDIDPKAVGVAYENAALNGIGRDRYTVLAGDVLSDAGLMARLAVRRYELVLANIVADVIMLLSARVPALLAPGGVFLCSGIVDTRAEEVAGALRANGLSIAEKAEKTGWVSFAAKQAEGG